VKYIVENQKVVDSNQNVLIDQNELDIFNIGSNITHVIEPKMLVFDGQFKSLEENIEDNDAEIALLATQSASQDILNDQFSNQNETLQNQLDNIMAKDFGEQIKTLSADIKFNEQSITNLSVSLDDKYQSLSNMDYTLLQSNIDLSTNLLSLSRASAGLATVVNEIV